MSDVTFGSLPVLYRPKLFKDYYGQPHVVSQLNGFIKRKRWPQTILITGNSGCGKTTLARIIARYINCKNPADDGTPCGECRSCKMEVSSNPDIHEKNMADTRGIDDVRSLTESAKSVPMFGGQRIFILDEIHMLTGAAANAFLKMLEEPPKRTVFILATTNPEKLLGTILGRCHRLEIRPIPPEVMSKRIRIISKREGWDLREVDGGAEIVKGICEMSNGQMRDAISMLDNALAAVSGNPDIDPKSLLSELLRTSEAELDKQAAHLVAGVLTQNLKMTLSSVRSVENARGLLNKTRWLIEFLLDKYTNTVKFTPYSGRIYAGLVKELTIKTDPMTLLRLQHQLALIELQFNSLSVPENILMASALGEFIASLRK